MPTLTSKGQVTIPKSLRDHLGLRPGSSVEFEIGSDGEAIIRASETARACREKLGADLESLRGSLDTGMSTDALMALLRGYEDDATDPSLR